MDYIGNSSRKNLSVSGTLLSGKKFITDTCVGDNYFARKKGA